MVAGIDLQRQRSSCVVSWYGLNWKLVYVQEIPLSCSGKADLALHFMMELGGSFVERTRRRQSSKEFMASLHSTWVSPASTTVQMLGGMLCVVSPEMDDGPVSSADDANQDPKRRLGFSARIERSQFIVGILCQLFRIAAPIDIEGILPIMIEDEKVS